MADKRLKFYPPNGGEPVTANPEYKQQYLDMGWTETPKENPKPDGKTTGKKIPSRTILWAKTTSRFTPLFGRRC